MDVCVSYFHFYRSSSSFGNFRGSWAEFLEMFLDGHGMYVVFVGLCFYSLAQHYTIYRVLRPESFQSLF